MQKKFSLVTGIGLIAVSAVVAQNSKTITDAVLKNAGKTGAEWLSYGLTPGETRYSPLKQIDATNVSRLGLAWSYDVGDGGGNQEATPLVSNGTIYSITNWSVVYRRRRPHRQRKMALGSRSQSGQRSRPRSAAASSIAASRIYNGKIIAPVIDGRLDRARRRNRQAGLGIARGLPAGQLHAHHGAAHRQRQSDHRRRRRRISRARLLRRFRRRDRPVRLEVLHRPRRSFQSLSRMTRMKKAAETWAGELVEDGRRRHPSGMACPTIPTPTSSTSAPATPAPGPKHRADKRPAKAKTTSMSLPSSP